VVKKMTEKEIKRELMRPLPEAEYERQVDAIGDYVRSVRLENQALRKQIRVLEAMA
jgi:hypothetical protein